MHYGSKLKKIIRPDSTKSQYRDSKKLWLDKNENSDETLAQKIKKILSKFNKNLVFSYPNLAPIYHKLSKNLGLSSKNILLTAGSDAGIKAVFETFVKKNDLVLRTNPTFAMYGVYIKIFNAKEVLANYKKTNIGPKIYFKDFEKIVLKKKPKLICLPNPDSPTGHHFSLNEIGILIKKAKSVNSFILIDEAYYPFHPYTCKKFLKKYSNLIIIRTTAKAWGMAGARVGYILSSKKNIKEMQKARPMYEINNLGAELFKYFLNNNRIIERSVRRLMAGKYYFKNEMIKLNFDVFKEEEGNFIHVKFKKNRKKIIKELKKISYFRAKENHKSLKNFSRFTITSKKNFKKIISKIKKCL